MRGTSPEGLPVGVLGEVYRQLMTDPLSAVGRLHTDERMHGYSSTDHLLLMILDALQLANWQRSKDGSKVGKRPKPLSPLAKPDANRRRYGNTKGRSQEAILEVLRKMRPAGRED